MKIIGVLGGMSAASTQTYYRELCSITQKKLGGLHSPELLIRSLDFASIEFLQARGEWKEAGILLNQEARALEAGGADFIILATNTMHKLASAMMEGVSIPFIHIATATADAILEKGLKRPGLIATAFTMEQNFYTDLLKEADLNPVLPEPDERARIHQIIYEELCKDIIKPQSRKEFEEIAQHLVKRGADCLILGCTEVGMLLNDTNVSVPVFDTTLIHCQAAFNLAYSE